MLQGGSSRQLLAPLPAESKRPKQPLTSTLDLVEHYVWFTGRFKHGWERTNKNWGGRKYAHLCLPYSQCTSRQPAASSLTFNTAAHVLPHKVPYWGFALPTHKPQFEQWLLDSWEHFCMWAWVHLKHVLAFLSTPWYYTCFYFSILAKQLKLFSLWMKLIIN